LEAEVEVVQGLDGRQPGGLDLQLPTGGLPRQDLAGTGLCLGRSGWDSYRLTARPKVLGFEEAQRLRLAHGGRVPLPAWAAALLSVIIAGNATQGLDRDDVPEPYRSGGIDVLLGRGLITDTARGYRPSDEVIFSLGLNPWQY
jgi:hypothetical protein